MEDLTIASCDKNVRTYFTKMQEMKNEIDSLRKDGIKYDEQRFLTLTFKYLVKKAGDFLSDFKYQCSKGVTRCI